jgi:formiminotetrahydrofolate cyclodeaminase
MNNSIWHWSLHHALESTAAPSPTPGGGSIAPVTGAFGLGLCVMALEITRAKHASVELSGAIAEGRQLMAATSAHADRDIHVFERYMDALSLPKSDDEARRLRQAALAKAALAATTAPLEAAEDGLAALRFVEQHGALAQPNVVSDILAGADIVLGSVRAVLRSVRINLPALADPEVRAQLQTRAQEVAAQADAVYARIMSALAETGSSA